MYKFKSYFFIGLTLLLGAAQTSIATDRDTQIKAIMAETGFDKLVQHAPQFAKNILKQSSGAMEPEVNSALNQAFVSAFASKAINKDVIAIINTHFNNKQASIYLDQLQSPLAKKIAALERTTNDPESRNKITAFAQQLKTKPATAERLALIERLDQATRITDFSVDMQTALFKAVFTAINPVLDEDMKIGSSEMEKMVNEVRQSFNDSYRENTRISYLYAFQKLSDTELTEYINVCESESYRWGVQLLGNAMISALNQAADRAAVIMVKNH